MSKFSLFKAATLAAIPPAALAVNSLLKRYNDEIGGSDAFAQHTRKQEQEHFFSGLHEPFISSNPEEMARFHQYFSQNKHLLISSVDEIKRKFSMRTSVSIRPLSECPVPFEKNNNVLAIGGPPALLSAGWRAYKDKVPVIYLCNQDGWPIANGSAWHLEEDAPTEAPTTYEPILFLLSQFMRLFSYKDASYKVISEIGKFPWRTLDWSGWLKNPSQWSIGLKVSILFQLNIMLEKQKRQAVLESLGEQCLANEKFYHALNKELKGQLLLPGHGSLIIARIPEEYDNLMMLKAGLADTGRELKILSEKELKDRFGFVPKGMICAEKPHDLVLSPKYNEVLSRYVVSKGGQAIDGVLTKIYIDKGSRGGVAEYYSENKKNYIVFSELYLSLGSQAILDEDNQPLFDLVSARGVSILANLYVPTTYKLPPVLVCGDTNHLTKLSGPIEIEREGKACHLYSVRITAGACITPSIAAEDGANYDGRIAFGLMVTYRRSLGSECALEPIFVYGCNRQISQHGQSTWIEPYPGLKIQFGAGGGGLTRAPEGVVTKLEESSPSCTHQV